MEAGFDFPDFRRREHPGEGRILAQPLCVIRFGAKQIANLVNGKDAITFDLLVGYDQEKQLEGIVPVSLGFAVQLSNGAPLEVLGQVISHGTAITLNGISVHSLVSP